ncbi:hypothetical protein [Longimicrobium terrae]|uniref:Uncharacterized protein n=1 Tax=Longimicrobium terrae TaxID=1639882 RepID=A0A841GWB6_9BACT|nr:hypothetical protein [Longimicrobium terrae]MBB4635912.1 hypothetical protein [Longimicrobium terrae]MBB6070308.1 hypothetical protein [Longimicrobium terrae]NNC30810.1 hypothetical protein [Longimicrobium terrae]
MYKRFHLIVMAFVPVLASLASPAVGQNVQDSHEIPGCGAALCEEVTVLVTALDTVFRHENSCGATPPFVLRTLHLAPYTVFPGSRASSAGERLGLPLSPPVMHIEHLGPDFLHRYWSDIRVVDSASVVNGAVPESACLFVFSPVTWLGRDSVRVIVAQSREQPSSITQWFVFLDRRRQGWRVVKLEAGFRS